MSASYSVSHLSDGALLQNLNSLVAKDRTTTAVLLAHLAEVEDRRLFAPAGYSSMFDYCMRELHMSEGATYKRIRAARLARRFPALLDALAEGRLHLSAIVLLKPLLTRANVSEIIDTATHKSKAEVEKLVVERQPRPDVPSRLMALPQVISAVGAQSSSSAESTPETQLSPGTVSGPVIQLSPGTVAEPVIAEPRRTDRPNKLTPLAPRRFAVQATVGEKGHNVIRRAQELLSHQIPSGDLGLILEFVFTEFVERRENQKFGSTQRPRKTRTKPSKNPRHIPRAVRRAVRERDGDCCKYSSPDGKRCGCRKFLEFDHIVPIAKGGESTVENLRLVCRTHNQHAAEETFGAGFMETKRHATG